MLRNKDIPQGIVANRQGYPRRQKGVPSYDGQQEILLRQYSDSQLNKVDNRLEKATKRLKVSEKGGIAVAGLSALAYVWACLAGDVEKNLLHTPFDMVSSVVGVVSRFDLNVASQLDADPAIKTLVFVAALTAPMVAPLIAAASFKEIAKNKRSQRAAISKEVIRREIEAAKLAKAASEQTA